MQMSDVIRKRNACCTTTAYALLICEEIIWIHPAVSEELCGNEIRHSFYHETIQTIHMQTKEAVIWKWDVLDSSNNYPLHNSEDFITNRPAIWQKFSNNKNIINLINYANEWRNLKTKYMLHNYIISSIIPENNTPFCPAYMRSICVCRTRHLDAKGAVLQC
jgi:hypothetical protein